MTPQFTTPCYIKIDDVQQRKEVCEKLSDMGYRMMAPYEYPLLQCSDGWVNDVPFEEDMDSIKCDSIPCFLDLAGMRNDIDLNQWVIDSDGNWHKCPDDIAQEYFDAGYDCGLMPKRTYRKATATEIINHYKQKGEKE